MAIKEGTRVSAFFETTEDTVYSFGNGTYEGNEVPPSNIQMMGCSVTSPTPKIKLDDTKSKDGKVIPGKIVWGCECWWTSEEQMEKEIAGRKVVVVDIDEKRAGAKKKKIAV